LITVDLSDFMVKGKNLLAIEVRDNRKDKPGFRADLTVKSLPGWDEKLEELRPELADEEMQKKLLIEKGRIP
jgi:hypothetical protein